MKRFLKNTLSQIGSTYAIMLAVFTIISIMKGVETVPVARLGQLAGLSVIGGLLMEMAFGTVLFPVLADVKRVCIFLVPFCFATLLFALTFGWLTKTDTISAYLRFIGVFLICGAVSVALFEVEHHIRGKRYTKQLKAYQHKCGRDENEY